jgi:tetratricopeptide (TPR) repeat protein
MYADRYGSHYPGGVLWLEVGPDRRTADSATPILQRIATYAYAADVQAQTLLENTVFAPDVVRALLRGHGALLVVIDDVWDPAVLRELQDALPDDAFVLLTTRDYHVAYALEGSDAAIQPLDVLSQADARQLLQKGAAGLSDELADRVAAGLGCHAQALALAAGALAFRRAQRYEQTATELLRRVAAGQGFGDLPRMDQAERLTAVEIALKYSYDELGQGEGGAQRQAWFRALGVFAQESDFDAAAAAAVWELEVLVGEEFILLLDGLGLLQETGADGTAGSRWQQHAILRAYALSLQTTEERIHLPERHADYYLALTQSCHESKPRDYDRVEREFAQIQHAFAWCEGTSPRRAMRLALLLGDFMRNRGRVALLNHWLQTALQGAEAHGDRLGKANTLQSLGDLESRLGNIEQARQHYDAALPLYEAEQDPIGKMNTWIGLARLEAGLGHVSEAERYYQRTFALAEQVHFVDHPVVLGWRQECTALAQTTARSPGEMSELQALADQLIAWIQTPDWADSEAYLQQHAADLLSDEAEAVLASLQQANPDRPAILQHLALLRRCRVIGIGPAYQEFHATQAAAQQAAQDPAAQALTALLQVDSAEALEHTLAQHPALLELPTLERLVAMVPDAAGQPGAARHLLALLGILLERYNHAHAEHVDLAEQARFVALHETLLHLAETLDDELAGGLRRSLAWALNTLGNAYATQDDHAAAVDAYTRAIAHAPEVAMLYRNRAGEHIEIEQWAQAKADIEQAAALEPDAPRLVDLRQALAQRQSE